MLIYQNKCRRSYVSEIPSYQPQHTISFIDSLRDSQMQFETLQAWPQGFEPVSGNICVLLHCYFCINRKFVSAKMSFGDRRLPSARHYAYDVIEMCAPLRRQRHLWDYRSRTLTPELILTLTVFLTLTRTLKIKENKTTPEYRST